MITKVRNLRQSFEYEANFEQDINNTTGLTFAFFAGEAFLQSGLTDIVAGTIAVPAGQFAVWLDVQTPATPTVKGTLLASVNSQDSIILFTGTASATDIDQSTVVDHRSFTTGQRGLSADAPTFNITNDPELSPFNTYWPMRAHMAAWDDTTKDWNPRQGNERQSSNPIFDEAAAPVRMVGVAQDNLTITGTPTFSQVGPTFLKGNAIGAMGFDGTSDYITSEVNSFSAAAVGAIWGWFYPFAAGAGGGRQIIAQSNAASSVSSEVLISGSNKLGYNNFTTVRQYRLDINTPLPANDTWHFFTVVQRGDGNGVQITMDGTLFNKDTGNTTETITGSGTRDDFYDVTWAALGRQGRFAARANTSASFKFEGRLFDVGLATVLAADFPLIWSAANVAKLHRCAGF